MLIESHQFGEAVANGAALLKAIDHINGYPLATLEDGIGLILACIADNRGSEDMIRMAWSDALTFYDHKDACGWFLQKFEGNDPANDLWYRGEDGRYAVHDSNLIDQMT